MVSNTGIRHDIRLGRYYEPRFYHDVILGAISPTLYKKDIYTFCIHIYSTSYYSRISFETIE